MIIAAAIFASEQNSSAVTNFGVKLHFIFTAIRKKRSHTVSSEHSLFIYLGGNCIQIFHLGRYIVGYTVGNLVLRRRVSGAVKRDFRTYYPTI